MSEQKSFPPLALAWSVWGLGALLYLIGFKNRIEVILNWSWNYFAFSRGARLIVGKDSRPPPKTPTHCGCAPKVVWRR